MLCNFDEINGILASMRDEGLVEPIDDPNVEVDFWDWADIIGVVDDFVPEELENVQCVRFRGVLFWIVVRSCFSEGLIYVR